MPVCSLKTTMWLLFSLSLILISLPLFGHLDALPIQQWDEARYANNALEMLQGHNWLITMYNGMPDMWCTKPPMMIWLQVLSMKMIGVNELAIRLPAAIAAVGTCLLIFFFFAKKDKDPLLGLVIVSILITTKGYVMLHGTRTGDLDSLLTMLTTGYTLFYFVYLEGGNRRYLLLTFLFLTLAILTKSIQATLFLPSLFIYTVYKKKLREVLRIKEFYLGGAFVIVFVMGFYLLREHYNPGYMATVWVNEIGGRYNTVIEGHNAGKAYYMRLIVESFFQDWYLFIVPGLIVGYTSKEKKIKDLTVCSFCLLVIYLAIITGAKTKLDWYLVPLFPFLSIIVGIFVYSVCKILMSIDNWKQLFSFNMLPYVFLLLLFTLPYKDMLTKCFTRPVDFYAKAEITDMEQFLKDVLHRQHNIDNFAIVDAGNEINFVWYYKALQHKHIPLKTIKREDIEPYSNVLAFRPDSRKFVQDNYNYQILTIYNNVVAYKLNGRKEANNSRQKAANAE